MAYLLNKESFSNIRAKVTEKELLAVSFFAHANRTEREMLIENSFMYEIINNNAEFYCSFDLEGRIFFVVKGGAFLCSCTNDKVKVFRIIAKGGCIHQALLSSPDSMIVPNKNAMIISMSIDAFEQLRQKNIAFLRAYCAYLEKIQYEQFIHNQLMAEKIEQRVVSFLCMHSKVNRETGTLQLLFGALSHNYLAWCLDTTRESVTRIFCLSRNRIWKELVRNAIIQVSPEELTQIGLA